MPQVTAPPILQSEGSNRTVAIGGAAIFITQFVSFLFINARNIPLRK